MRFNELKKKLSENWGRGNDRMSLDDSTSAYWSGNGPLQKEYEALYDQLVPAQGRADTVEGEVLRAASKIYYRHFNDGDEFNHASFGQLVQYIGKVTSYDDLAHKATEFAMAANGQYHPNDAWDSLDVMEYGPTEDDYEDEDWDDEEDDWDDEDEELDEAAGQVYTVNITKRSSFGGEGRTRTTSGTIPELLEYFGYTLEVGKSYEHERGRYKINMTPKNIQSLVDNLNKAASNGARNGHSSTYYEVGEEQVAEARTTWNNDFYVYDPKTKTVKKKFRTHKGAKQYAEANGLKVASAEHYHDSVSKEVDEGWESGPEEYKEPYDDADDAYDRRRQEKLDAETEREQAKRPQTKIYSLLGRGPNMEPNYKFPGEYDSLDAAVAARKELMADPSTPHPEHIGISSRTKYLDESTVTPLRDREDYQAKSKALQDIQMDPDTHKDPQLSAELARRKDILIHQAKQLGIDESRAHKVLNTWFKNKELQDKFAKGELKVPTPQERRAELEKQKTKK